MNIDVGLLNKNNKCCGIYIILPCKPISLNEYAKMHWAVIKKIKGEYKSMLDLIILQYINTVCLFGEFGLKTNGIFCGRINIEWILSFKSVNTRDPANYTQKILLDAIVMTGIITDDSQKYVISDKTFISNETKEESIICIMLGDINTKILHNSINSYEYEQFLENRKVINE